MKRHTINPPPGAVLEAAGASLDDIVELTTFHTDLRGDAEAFSRVKDEYITAPYPSWTAVGVTQLALPELLVEICAVAVAGSGNHTGASIDTSTGSRRPDRSPVD
ncbi:Rid family hydrolase [Streptomyces sp. NPDC017529]|uniref:Rid family hydrolase n=1 Tax=Streptomyces sp. NPDC017529 TaxID=3365000 RepID=UPI00379299E1